MKYSLIFPVIAGLAQGLSIGMPNNSNITTPLIGNINSADAQCADKDMVEKITDYYLFEVPLPDFLIARQQHKEELDWSSNGCTGAPEKLGYWKFHDACLRHDFGYRNYRIQNRCNTRNKKKIDQKFHNDLRDMCDDRTKYTHAGCKAAAWTYYHFAKKFGDCWKSACTQACDEQCQGGGRSKTLNSSGIVGWRLRVWRGCYCLVSIYIRVLRFGRLLYAEYTWCPWCYGWWYGDGREVTWERSHRTWPHSISLFDSTSLNMIIQAWCYVWFGTSGIGKTWLFKCIFNHVFATVGVLKSSASPTSLLLHKGRRISPSSFRRMLYKVQSHAC